jgi:PBP1b-binding outer membrane lipoprotein LpoB
MRKLLSIAVLTTIAFVVVGCGNSGDKDKNKNKDVPTKASKPE